MKKANYSRKCRILYGVEILDGGVYEHLRCLVSYLDKERFQIYLLVRDCDQNRRAAPSLREIGAVVDFIPMSRTWNVFTHIGSVYRIIRYIHRTGTDVVHAHSSLAGFLFRTAACFCGIKSVYTPHCFYFASWRGWKRALYRRIEQLLGIMTSVVVVAENERLLLEKCALIQKCRVIHNAVDPLKYRCYRREEAIREFGILPDKQVVCGVGRLVRQKDWRVFLALARRVVAACPDKFVFIIAGAGEGDAVPNWQHIAEDMVAAGQVRFLGYVEDVSKVYACADIFVSTSAWEGLPYTYLEAVHFGIPMLIRETEHIGSVLDKESCLIFGGEDDLPRVADMIITKSYSQHPGLAIESSIRRFTEEHQRLYAELTGDL